MKITPSQISRGNQYLRNDLSLVFNEAVSVWESFPFTTGEKLPGRSCRSLHRSQIARCQLRIANLKGSARYESNR